MQSFFASYLRGVVPRGKIAFDALGAKKRKLRLEEALRIRDTTRRRDS